MRAFRAATIGLSPFLLFWTLASVSPSRASFAALSLSLALNLWRGRTRKQMDAASLALFAALSIGFAVAPLFFTAHALALSFFAVSVAAFVSLGRKKPWTADYSAIGGEGQRENPIFIGVNMALSSLWMGVFLLLGFSAWFSAPFYVAPLLAGAGALASIFGPDLLVRAVLRRKIAEQRDYDWLPPDFSRPGGEEVDVAVIGAGMGGLTAAALLAEAGLKVKIFEQHVVPGGYCHSWLRKAHDGGKALLFRFDAGPHDFSGAFPGGSLDLLLQKLGCADKIDWLRLDYRMNGPDGANFDPPRDWREHVRALGRLHPEDAAGIDVVFTTMKALFDAIIPCDGRFPGRPDNVESMLDFARRHPLYVRWGECRYVELLDHAIRTPAARAALLAMVGYISDDEKAPSCAEMAPIFGYYFNGGFYPRGGTSRYAEALADAVTSRGGEIAYKTGVQSILVERGRSVGVRLENGTICRARAVIANSDMRKTFLDLVDPADLPAAFRAKIAAAPPATSGFAVHLGVRGDWPGQPLTFVSGKRACLIVRPGLVDPTDAPEGYCSVDLFTLLPHREAASWFPPEGANAWRDWRRSPDYLRRKEALAEELIDAAEKALPGLRARILFRCEASPFTYARYDRASAGAIYGIAPDGRMRGAKSPIAGLVVAGAVNFGPGVEAAVLSGVTAAEALKPGASRPAPHAGEKRGLPAAVE